MPSETQQAASTVIKSTPAQIELKRIPDPNALKLFWYLFAGSRGGDTRLKIMIRLIERPYNRNQLAKTMGLDYKAIQHHFDVLEKNNLITKQGEEYGIMYFVSTYLEAKLDAFYEIWNKVGKK